jgi:hypothetical protein
MDEIDLEGNAAAASSRAIQAGRSRGGQVTAMAKRKSLERNEKDWGQRAQLLTRLRSLKAKARAIAAATGEKERSIYEALRRQKHESMHRA